jgi:hypothetical protein
MEEVTEMPKKKAGWPKGKKRGPKLPYVKDAHGQLRQISDEEAFTMLQEEFEAPIFVRIRLKNWSEYVEFGCSRREVANGFHVFFYPSLRDRFRETRREFAISEVVEVEITEPRPTAKTEPQVQPQMPAVWTGSPAGPPVIHNAKENALRMMKEKVEAKLDAIPGITFGDSLA